MTGGARVAMWLTAFVTAIVGIASLALGWFLWAVALNGFMGQQRAAATSMTVYLVLAAGAVIIATFLSALLVYWLAGKRGWNAVGSAVLSSVLFIAATVAIHFVSVIVSALVADMFRTNR